MKNIQKILVIDDDVISNRVILSYLENTPYPAETLTDSKQAWQILSLHPDDYHLILLDRMMFGIDGMELLRRIKANAQLKHLPVIMITGEAELEDEQAAIAAGAAEFIYKPITENFLIQLLKKYLNNK